MSVPHPIPYQGSKRQLASVILEHIPSDAKRLVEPFAGSAAVSLAAAQSGKVQNFLLNDINTALIQLWEAILDHPTRLSDMYAKLWAAQSGRERRFYDLVRQRFKATHQPYYLLYLLARCVKAAVRYNANGEFNQSPDNRRKGRQPNAMRRDIQAASVLLKGKTTLMNDDYQQVLKHVNRQDFVYLDPPYQGVCANGDPRYIMGIQMDELVFALADLNKRDIAYVLSYDGRTGSKCFGQPLPAWLNLTRIEVKAGRSSQATLLGRAETTYESLYLSPAVLERQPQVRMTQLDFFGSMA